MFGGGGYVFVYALILFIFHRQTANVLTANRANGMPLRVCVCACALCSVCVVR